jgi:hypothetical protein
MNIIQMVCTWTSRIVQVISELNLFSKIRIISHHSSYHSHPSHTRARYNMYGPQQLFLFLSVTSVTCYKISFHIYPSLAWFLKENGQLCPCIDRWDEMKWGGSTRQY